MINPDLERRFADCNVLMEEWQNFHSLLDRSLKSQEVLSAPLEQQFLSNKARIAMLHDSFMESIKGDKTGGARLLELVNRSITLKLVRRSSEAEQRKMESEWHECFLNLNETISQLNEDRAQLADVNEFTYKCKKLGESVIANVMRSLGSIYFKLAVVLVVVIGVFFAAEAYVAGNHSTVIKSAGFLKSPLQAYFSINRTLGRDFPYIDMGSFADKMKDSPNVTLKVSEGASKDSAVSQVAFLFEGDATFTDRLNKSFDYRRYSATKSSGSPSTAVHVFFYDRIGDAAAAQAPTFGKDRAIAVRKANVLIVVEASGDKAFAAEVKREIIDKL
jgi:hypothetical protein